MTQRLLILCREKRIVEAKASGNSFDEPAKPIFSVACNCCLARACLD